MIVRTLRRISSSLLGRRSRRLDTAWRVISWREARRVPFNLVVGATGIVTSVLILLIAWQSECWLGVPVGLPDPPIPVIGAVIAFAVAANACLHGRLDHRTDRPQGLAR